MNRRIAFPFLTLSDASIEASPWEVSVDGNDWVEAGEFLPDWDSSCDVHIRRTVRLVPEVAVIDLSLSIDDLQLLLGVRLGTGQGRLPRLVMDRKLERVNLDNPVWKFERVIEGRALSMVLDLQTEVILASPPASPGVLSPRAFGDRLWSDSVRIRLEGEEPRFPIETADLGQLLGEGVASGAPWYLHWSPRDWSREFNGAVRLYLNESAAEFLERIENEDPATLQLILADIMSQICERFLVDAEAVEWIDAAEPGSLGAQAEQWLRKAWPGKDVAFIRSVLESRPGAFRSAFLALAELGEA
ncbi:hypothetical protein [Thioalkalivibrio sp. ALJ24]|uniref:hypothetical protein n=1 Tax=Thioalkalivibrio sp. ALJ24 TaxID=545276 RepID=UPI000477A22A|nr:hypothetical protein [Thioalkalivibrio sp. ALJ24]